MEEKPRRVITIHLPHREQATAAFLVCLLAGVALLGMMSPLIFPPAAPEEEETPETVTIPNAQLAGAALNQRVNDLLAQMTLEEKIGQLTQYSAGALTGPGSNMADLDKLAAQGQVGSLFNIVGATATNHYQHLAVEKSRLHIPLLFGYDVIHGETTIFPVPLALASTWNPDLVQATARCAAEESTNDGIRWVFSPMVDIARDARWGRITEGAGEDTFLGSAFAAAYVRGYQGSDLSKPAAVAACVKHFAAYGAPQAGREYNTVDMSELTLRQVYLPPYKAAIDAGAATVMSAFNPLNGVPATADPFTLTKILREEWHFGGFVVSDYGAVSELIEHGVATTKAIAAKKAISAGVDMDMMSDLYRTRLSGLVKEEELPEPVIDEAVRRVLRVKFALGLFDHPYADESKPPSSVTPGKRTLARRAAEESIVLLKNGEKPVPFAPGPMLPLRKDTPTIALIGPLADSPLDMLGSWAAQGAPKDAVTLRAALQARCDKAKTKLIFTPGTDILTQSDTGFPAAVAAARQADVVIMALGESAPRMTGESSSVTRLDLPGNQEDLLELIQSVGKPVVLVLFDGRPLAIKWAAENVPAIVEAWYPGIEAGNAVAEVLFGDVNPSGKLTATFPRAVGQEPLFYNQLPTGRPADDIDLTHPPTGQDKYFSRYIDETNAPLYAFGYGLSYTTFTYSQLRLSQDSISVDALSYPQPGHFLMPVRHIQVSCTVKNTGPVSGAEVAQLYIRNIGGSVEEPVRELRGFQRVTLKPGESRVLTFSLGFRELSYYNLDMERVIEPTQYDVWVGGSSDATLGTQFEVTEK
ncbi:MAG TPA: glycoside hydrolase family 3 N-terminal domain-containing protein [Candidatus Methylacidiphilales bacterium]|nr:glycoside hydrolase family 3 N-terminal domain-containing protein [Candidatus Methylacidiphilales bacterium]